MPDTHNAPIVIYQPDYKLLLVIYRVADGAVRSLGEFARGLGETVSPRFTRRHFDTNTGIHVRYAKVLCTALLRHGSSAEPSLVCVSREHTSSLSAFLATFVRPLKMRSLFKYKQLAVH
jgi:hypothetical protein